MVTRSMAFVAALLLCVAAARPSAEPGLEAADAAWAAVIEAKGGSDRLDAVRTVALSAKSPQPMAGRREQLIVLPHRNWEWLDARPTVFGLELR